MNVLFETAAKRRIHTLAPGDMFRVREDDIYPHTRIAVGSPYLLHKPGKVYSLCRGVIVEHDATDVVFVLDVTCQP